MGEDVYLMLITLKESETKMTASVLKENPHIKGKKIKKIMAKHNMRIFGVSLLFKLQNDT